MSRPLSAQLFTKPGKGEGDEEKRQKRERAAARARDVGPSDVLENLNPLKKADEWSLERQRKQEEVRNQYFRDKHRLHAQERRAEEQLKREVERRKREIAHYYRVGQLARDDVRWKAASRKARRKFERYENKVQRKHNQQWLKSFRQRRIQRDKQYRQITRAMKKEHRRSRGLPDGMQAPWNF